MQCREKLAEGKVLPNRLAKWGVRNLYVLLAEMIPFAPRVTSLACATAQLCFARELTLNVT